MLCAARVLNENYILKKKQNCVICRSGLLLFLLFIFIAVNISIVFIVLEQKKRHGIGSAIDVNRKQSPTTTNKQNQATKFE